MTGPDASVTVRALTPDDWPVYRRIRLAMLADSPDAYATALADAQGRDESAWRQVLTACAHFLAEQPGAGSGQGGATVGSGVGAGVGAAGLVEHDGDQNLIGMYVAPDHRGGPVATLLVDAVADLARARGASRLLLDVVTDNQRAQRFYERCGFVPTGRVQGVPGREQDLEIQLALAL